MPRPLRDPSSSVVLSSTVAEAGGERVDDPAAEFNRNHRAVLDGARRAVLAHGRVVTMAQIAVSAGVARDTVHRHFASRDDVLRALLMSEIDEAVSALAVLDLPRALARAAELVSGHPLLEALAGDQVSTLASMARVDVTDPAWGRVAAAVDGALQRAGRRGAPMVLRWLASFLLAPAESADIAADVAVLVAGLPYARPRSAARAG